jgi:hypothetical protein
MIQKSSLTSAITDILKVTLLRLAAFGALAVMLHPSHVAAATSTGISPNGLPDTSADDNTLQTVLQIFFGIIGAFAVLNITASGFKYITSSGDPQKTSEAKKGVAFALVGLAIAISAEAIVTFLVDKAA